MEMYVGVRHGKHAVGGTLLLGNNKKNSRNHEISVNGIENP